MKKVRPFKMNEIYLNELPELDTIDPNDPEIALHISNVLTAKVNDMIR